MATNDLTAQRLRDLLNYSPETGNFVWRVTRSNGTKAGASAGAIDQKGYTHIMIDDRDYRAHRLAMLWMTGRWPVAQVDHINGCRSDNRWLNLRQASASLNKQNMRKARADSSTGIQGVSWVARLGKFRARLKVGNKNLSLGCFSSAEHAYAAYVSAKRRLHEGCTL